MDYLRNQQKDNFEVIEFDEITGIKIRKAQEDDLEDIYHLACSCLNKEDEQTEKILYSIEYYKKNILDPK